MIYTMTFNPALDYIVTVENLELGMTNRTADEYIVAGGKGINVSIVLNNLGIATTALGFIAGFTGEEIKKQLQQRGCNTEFIQLKTGCSRINVKIQNDEGTEINGTGPNIQQEELQQLKNRLDLLTSEDVLVLAGSIPKTLPDHIYEEIMKQLQEKQVLIVVDATKDLLLNTLKYKPFLIKPNNYELGEIFDCNLTTKEEIIPYAKKLQQQGAQNVLISMAGEGAVFVDEMGKVYECSAPKGTLVNGVGAGDSMIAGFLAGWIETKEYETAFKMGVATGSASAFSRNLATREEMEALLNHMI